MTHEMLHIVNCEKSCATGPMVYIEIVKICFFMTHKVKTKCIQLFIYINKEK